MIVKSQQKSVFFKKSWENSKIMLDIIRQIVYILFAVGKTQPQKQYQIKLKGVLKMKKVTLEQIIEKEKQHRHEGGRFGIAACKESIKFDIKTKKCSLYELLEEYVKCSNEIEFFNRAMVLACWELINEEA
jgi:hypothetical protein